MNKMSILLVFRRKVIPIENRVECQIVGLIEGESANVGSVNFPSKQSWTKFWGAIQRGSLAVPDFDVKMENVSPEDQLDEEKEISKLSTGVKVVGSHSFSPVNPVVNPTVNQPTKTNDH